MERVAIASLRGAEAAAAIEDLADLRLTIFREFPYLYDGRREDELDYLARYARTPDALVVTVSEAGKVVGAATGIPLAAEGAALVEPVAGSSYPVAQLYYVGELLFYQEYRNRGLGLRLLAEVERQVRSMGGYRYLACATIVRPENQPARPAGYLPIERFLARTGFKRLDDLQTSFTWRELDGASCEHPMKYWIKELV